MANIMESPSAQSHTLGVAQQAPAGAWGRLVVLPGDNRAVLIVGGLSPLPADKTYEFWLARGNKMRPSGLFQVDSRGRCKMLVTSSDEIGAYDKMGVSIEQKAGEAAPRGPIVMQGGF